MKLRLLGSEGHRWADAERLGSDADWALHREVINRIRSATLPERRLAPTLKMLGASVGRYPRLALKPEAWRLVGASLLGPRVVARMGGR